MPTKSELFIKELVVDVAEMLFKKYLPEYDLIEIEDKWKNVSVERYPNEGIITFKKDNWVVAKIYFKVKFGIEERNLGRRIIAEPTELVLELPDGTKYGQIKKYICDNCNQEIEKDCRFCPLCGMERDNYQEEE